MKSKLSRTLEEWKDLAGKELKGKNSDYIQEKHIPIINNFFPNYSLREIANSGHWPHTEQQDLFRKELLTFFM